MKEGATITILNAYAKVQNKLLKLDLDKWSKVVATDQSVESVNTENNISAIEHEETAKK